MDKVLIDNGYLFNGTNYVGTTDKFYQMVRQLVRESMRYEGKEIVYPMITNDMIIQYLKNKNEI